MEMGLKETKEDVDRHREEEHVVWKVNLGALQVQCACLVCKTEVMFIADGIVRAL